MTEIHIREILSHLPHRYPFLLIDRVTEFTPMKSLTAIKNVSMNEPHFTGHFPSRPVMPGVLILEAMAQATGILALKSTETTIDEDSLYFFAGVDNARFKKIVEPGDQLIITVNLLRMKNDVLKFTGEALVDGQLACSADLMCARRKA